MYFKSLFHNQNVLRKVVIIMGIIIILNYLEKIVLCFVYTEIGLLLRNLKVIYRSRAPHVRLNHFCLRFIDKIYSKW